MWATWSRSHTREEDGVRARRSAHAQKKKGDKKANQTHTQNQKKKKKKKKKKKD